MTAPELERLVAQRVEQGRCGCGCGGEIPVPAEGKRKRQKFLPDHRQRVYKLKVQAVASQRGLEPRLSLSRLQGPTATSDRSGHAQSPGKDGEASESRRSRPSGAQLPYKRSVQRLTQYFRDDCGEEHAVAREMAEDLLKPLLSDRQRQRLEDR